MKEQKNMKYLYQHWPKEKWTLKAEKKPKIENFLQRF